MSNPSPASRPFRGRITDVDELIEETRDKYEAAVATVKANTPHSSGRIRDLCIIRESDSNDFLDAEGLIAQLASLFPDLSGIEAVNRLGIEPLRRRQSGTLLIVDIDPQTGEEVEHKTHLNVIREGRTRASLFTYQGVHYLYSLSSAAKVDELGSQEWTDLLMKQLARLRPENVRTINMSRFVRNQDVAGSLLNAMAVNVKRVWLGSVPLEMKGPRAPMDKLLFVMLAMAAAIERDAIVARTSAGKLNKLRNGIWISGERAVPIGYVLDDAHQILPDPAQGHVVRELLLLVAEKPTPKEFVNRLGAMGVKLQAIPSVGLEKRSAAFARQPYGKWLSVLSHMPLYATGEHIVHAKNPFPGVNELGGMAVVEGDAGHEEVQVVLKPGVPGGGWAEPEIVSAALAVAIEHSGVENPESALPAVTAATLSDSEVHARVLSLKAMKVHKPKAVKTLPWSGTRWQNSRHGHTWELDSRGGKRYVLVRHREESNADAVALTETSEDAR